MKRKYVIIAASILLLIAGFVIAFAFTWTDSTITANVTKVRKVHIDELRANINTLRSNFGFSASTWTDPAITADSTKARKVHVDELRSAISQVKTYYYTPATSWTDPTITAGSTKVRKVHIDELRAAADGVGTCRSWCGACKACSGTGGCVNQSSSQDLYNDCSGACYTGNCNGAGGCGYSGAGTDCGTCYVCNGSGSCVYDAGSEPYTNCGAWGACNTTCGWGTQSRTCTNACGAGTTQYQDCYDNSSSGVVSYCDGWGSCSASCGWGTQGRWCYYVCGGSYWESQSCYVSGGVCSGCSGGNCANGNCYYDGNCACVNECWGNANPGVYYATCNYYSCPNSPYTPYCDTGQYPGVCGACGDYGGPCCSCGSGCNSPNLCIGGGCGVCAQ